jgi:UDP-2,3-diacylglucosamine hydrolase
MLIRRVWIFSDLHIENLKTDLARAFLRTLELPEGPGDAVVFAGDLFELWVGDSPYFSEKFSAFSGILQGLLAKGVRIDYIEGNHDFHLSGILPAGVNVVPVGVALELESSEGARRLWIEHGDLADREDRSYLRMRAVLRSTPVRLLSRLLPGPGIESIASRISRPADQKTGELPEHWSEGRRNRLRSVYRAHAEAKRSQGFDFVVMGHCHDLDDWGGFYWNMGYPPVHRQYLVFAPPPGSAKVSLERRNFL